MEPLSMAQLSLPVSAREPAWYALRARRPHRGAGRRVNRRRRRTTGA